MKNRGWIFLFLSMMIFSSCNTLKNISEKDPLYTGAKIKIKSQGRGVSEKNIRNALDKDLLPQPNTSILGFRPQLWFYNMGQNKEKGLKKWLSKKFGKPPVTLSHADPDRSSDIMLSYLDSKGFFRSEVSHEIKKKKKKASVEYLVMLPKPYRIGIYDFPSVDDSLSAAINNTREKNILNRDNQYDLDLLKQERLRIDAKLKEAGYYFFSHDYLLFEADTTAGDKHVNLKLSVKEKIPEKARIPYYIRDVFISPSYSLTRDSILQGQDTILTGGYHYIDDGYFRHNAIIRSIFITPEDKYNRQRYNLTIKRLMGMGVFSYVSVKFSDTIYPSGKGYLDARILLTRRASMSLSAEPDLVTKSNNYSGPALRLSFKNRNIFRGAEQLTLNIEGNYEFQISGSQKGFNSYGFGATTQLVYPRFILPFRIDDSKSLYVPKTKIEAGFKFIHRMQLFDMISMDLTFGYMWKTSDKDEFEVNPVALNFSKILRSTDEFDQLLEKNSYLRRSFEEQFIFGSELSYTHNGLLGAGRRHMYYLNGTLDLSGNILSLFQSFTKSYKNTEERPYELFGYHYSQFSRLYADGRYYYTFDKNNRIVTRLLAGFGIPYGNSRVMPYLKQFFSGGSNSIRAFLPRSLGPGSYIPPDSILANSYFDQSGDIKLEANVEFRFTIVSILKGAIFLDAGNVWLMRADTNYPGGEFSPDRFMKEIAVGTGLGLRLDLNIFVIRFDLGMPLRKPNLPEGERWVVNKIDFGSPRWRKDNLVLNIAIGYPF